MSPPALETVALTVRPSGVCVIELNRPNRGNAFNAQLCLDWTDALQWAIKSDNVKIIVQTGRGKYYSTGLASRNALTLGMELTPDAFEKPSTGDSFGSLYTLIETIINSPKPLIAAVNGPAIGIGVTSLALYDLVYSVPHATFHTPFMRWGLAAEGGSSVTFPMQLGHPKATALLLAGEVMTAQDLQTAGMITRIIPADKFMEGVFEVAERMAGYSQSAIRTTREMVRGKLREKLHAANLRECQALRDRNVNNDALPNIIEFIKNQEEKKRNKAKL